MTLDTNLVVSGANLTFGASVNGVRDLTINSGGVTTLGGPLGNTTALISVSTDAAGSTRLAGGSVTTMGGLPGRSDTGQ